MLIAIPITNDSGIYHSNPFTAPRFGIYAIEQQKQYTIYTYKYVVENPWAEKNNGIFDDEQITCNCSIEKQCELTHMVEHYGLADLLSDCTYMLVDKRCSNIEKTFKKMHIKLYKIPSIINDPASAIKNLIIGVSLANNVQDIHYAS